MDAADRAASADVHEVRRGAFVVTRLHRTGVSPHRVLLIGSRRMLAPAGRDRAETFGARVTDRLWLRTRRGVDVDMVWELRPVLTAMREGLQSARLWRYDAVVILIAERSAGLQDRWGFRGVHRLLGQVVDEVAASTHVLLVSFDAGSSSRRGWRAHASSSGPSTELMGSKVGHLSTSSDERIGSDAVAEQLLGLLAASDAAGAEQVMDEAHRHRSSPGEEGGRQRAVDDLGLHGRRVGERLQRVVDTARETFGSASAEISIIDDDRRWALATSGARSNDMPRVASLCNRAIQRATPTVVGDLWTDPELRGNPLVAANDPIRFYASYPIESLDGYRIGVLCVWDDVPHPVQDFDVSTLRDLALLAEAEIISADG